MKLLLSRVLHQQNKTMLTCVSVNSPLDTVYPVSQFTNAKAALGLLTQNQVDYVAPVNQIFFFNFSHLFVLYPERLSAPFCSSPKGVCPFHEMLSLFV